MLLKSVLLAFAFAFCASSFAGVCDGSLALDFENKVATRGFMDATPLDDPKGYELAKQGLMAWVISIYIKPSVEAAKAHYDVKEAEERLAQWKTELAAAQDEARKTELQKLIEVGEETLKGEGVKDPMTKGAYLIADLPADFESMDNEKKLEVYRKVFPSSKLIYFDRKTGEAKTVSEAAKAKLNPNNTRVLNLGVLGYTISNPGWVFPEMRGALKLDKETLGGSTYKNLKGEARKFAAKGYTFHFNYNFQKSLEMLRDQERRGQTVEQSRYKQEAAYNKAIEAYKKGHGFSVEMVDKNGQIKGGLICFRYGNLVTIDSVFYQPPNEGDIDLSQKTPEEAEKTLKRPLINFAKMPVLALIERLQAVGIDFIDMGMVTSYSRSLKAQYVESDEFLRMMSASPKDDVVIDLSGIWTPPLAGQK